MYNHVYENIYNKIFIEKVKQYRKYCCVYYTIYSYIYRIHLILNEKLIKKLGKCLYMYIISAPMTLFIYYIEETHLWPKLRL